VKIFGHLTTTTKKTSGNTTKDFFKVNRLREKKSEIARFRQ
jgi:hypothetical protein